MMPLRRRRSLRPLWPFAAMAVLALSFACRLDMLLGKNQKELHPILTVHPTEVRDSVRAGSSDVRQARVAITNSGDGTLTWSASDHSAWIHLDPNGGNVPDTLTIELDPDGLDAGMYQGDVIVMAKDAVDSQFTTIPVTFIVQRPGLSVSPTSIDRSTSINSGETFTETLQITNTGTGALTWTASEDKSWLSLGVRSGSGNGSIPVTIKTEGLGRGTYRGDIVITAPGAAGSPAHVAVTLIVLAPGLAVSPASIKDTTAFGATTPETKTLHVTNSGNGEITWSATKSQPWLSLSKATGGAPEDVTVSLNPTGLPPGTARDTIVFTAPGAVNGPVLIPVEFAIVVPGLAVAPSAITATADQRDNKKQHFTLSITNSAGGPLAWVAAADQPWIAIGPPGGLAPSTLSVDLDPQGLPLGANVGTITVSSPGAVGSPFNVPVTMTITSKACNDIAIALDVIDKPGVLDANDCDAPHRPGSFANIYAFSANAGDTISIRLTADFDPYLLLNDGAGNVLAQNHTCPGETRTSCITAFGITATGPYRIEATSAAPGASGALTITVVRERPPTAPQGMVQLRVNNGGGGDGVIDVGNTIDDTEIILRARVDDPTESDFVRLEVELEPVAIPFTGAATHVSDYVSAAGGGAQAFVHPTNLTNRTSYRWQARTCDRTGRCSLWVPFGNNADSNADFTVLTSSGSSPRTP